MFVSDVVLLLTMLAGLLRLRRHGSMFALGKFLWRQVSIRSKTTRPLGSLISFSSQGLIWLFFATIAEVPPVVSVVYPLVLLSSLIVVFAVGIYQLGFEL